MTADPARRAAVLHYETVRPEWIDYNGHMNLAYYVLVFDHATDVLFDTLGIGAHYVGQGHCSMFAVETHTLYEREVHVGDPLRVEAFLIDADAKRLHFAHAMHHATEGWRAATQELMSLHVDMTARRTAPFPIDRMAAIDEALLARPPVPDWVGRRIAMPLGSGVRA
ncbi:MAG TPA: thioesterase family protein [Acidisphaera sp.]|nr:thioesterase family protein [Acidisphaera sp.]